MQYKDSWDFAVSDDIAGDLQDQSFEEIKQQMAFFKASAQKNAKNITVKENLIIRFKFSIALIELVFEDESEEEE